jgi:hypothetical protein
VDGDKVTLAPTIGDKSQTIVLTVKDGSLVGPPGGVITKLDKVKCVPRMLIRATHTS